MIKLTAISVKEKLIALSLVCSFFLLWYGYMSVLTPTSALSADGSLGVYSDRSCTKSVTSLDWGVLSPGSTVTRSVYIKNQGETDLAISINTRDWSPPEASRYITVEWDREGFVLSPGGVIKSTFSLRVSGGISGVYDFAFQTIVLGTFEPSAGKHMVVRGSNNEIFYTEWDEASSSWGGWVKLPGSTPDRPAAVRIGSDLHLVVRSGDGGIFHGVFDTLAKKFSGWARVSGVTASAPSLAAAGSGLILTVRGNDDRIYYSRYEGSWSAWRQLPGTTPDAAGTSVIGDTYHIMVRGSDSRMYHGRMGLSTGEWYGWTLMTGTSPSQPELCGDGESLYLVVRGSDDGIYWREYDSSWSGWRRLPGSTLQSPGSAARDNELWVCVTGAGNGFYYGYIELDKYSWGGWSYLGGSSPSSPTLAGE